MFETDRLLISPIKLSDSEEVRLIHNHPETLKWLSDDHLVSHAEQVNWVNSIIASKVSSRFVVREKNDSRIIGVFRFDRYDSKNLSAEIGLDIAFSSRRQGFAREVYINMFPYLFIELGLNRLSLLTLTKNTPAINMYESLGFTREGISREMIKRGNEYLDVYQYSMLASEYGDTYEPI
jgi:RimJ/RimL family protein N-acetyltransferase